MHYDDGRVKICEIEKHNKNLLLNELSIVYVIYTQLHSFVYNFNETEKDSTDKSDS